MFVGTFVVISEAHLFKIHYAGLLIQSDPECFPCIRIRIRIRNVFLVSGSGSGSGIIISDPDPTNIKKMFKNKIQIFF